MADAEEALDSGVGGAGGPIGSGGGDQSPNSAAATHKRRVKSCKGCLYYSSLLKADARNPICFGITRNLPRVPGHIVGKSEMEATTDFKYSCVGYSVFFNNQDNPNDKQENRAELPFCNGIKLLVDRRTSSSEHVPTHVHYNEDGIVHSQPQSSKSAHNLGEQFLDRFKRSASLVASGVARNLNRVGSYIKENLDDIMYPYRRRPK